MATPTVTTALFRVLGTTDDVTECEQCGRDELKSTVILGYIDPHSNDIDDVTYMGSDCAARATGWKQTTIRSHAAAADRKAKRDALNAYNTECDRIRDAFQERYHAWLRATRGTDDVRLGGPLVSRPREKCQLEDTYKAATGDRPVYPTHPHERKHAVTEPTENTPEPRDDAPMTVEEARAHFEAMGVEIRDDITVH